MSERALLRTGLSRPLPEIPAQYFYDDRGSELFEQITRLPAYYPTRTEIRILRRHAADILAAAEPAHIAELGSGAGRKIRTLLDAWRPAESGATCTMLDVNASFLSSSVHELSADYPRITFRSALGDFTKDIDRLGPGGCRLTVFFGSTLGNLKPPEQKVFFATLAAQMSVTDTLLVGVDLVKDRARLEAAYNDPEGVTAEFNKNMLRVINRRFGSDFDPDAFEHRAFYDAENAWIEMRLVASRPMLVRIPALELDIDLHKGSELRTEVSCKFTRASLSSVAGGLSLAGWYTDPDDLFALALFRRRPD